jgi:hypothetical protein
MNDERLDALRDVLSQDPDAFAGDWILRIEIQYEDRLLARLDGVYANREQAMAAVSTTLGDMDWSNILEVHGDTASRTKEFRIIDGARLSFWCGPRSLL